MSDSTIHVDIVSAEGEIFSGEASMVFVPAVMGDIGIAPRHAPLLTTLRPGEVRVQTPGGDEQFFFVSGGALEIQPHVVTVLADTALRAHDLDEAAASAAKERAEEALRNRGSAIEVAEAQAELARAAAQIRAIEKRRADLRLARVRAVESGRAVLSADQREKLRTLLAQEQPSMRAFPAPPGPPAGPSQL